MPRSLFHPAVAAWFESRFGAPTEAQAQAWPAIQAGRHTLIAAPTGSGKTLAAFLSSIDVLVRRSLIGGVEGGLPDAPQVVYVSPLKALLGTQGLLGMDRITDKPADRPHLHRSPLGLAARQAPRKPEKDSGYSSVVAVRVVFSLESRELLNMASASARSSFGWTCGSGEGVERQRLNDPGCKESNPSSTLLATWVHEGIPTSVSPAPGPGATSPLCYAASLCWPPSLNSRHLA
jgi:hypothetical protein